MNGLHAILNQLTPAEWILAGALLLCFLTQLIFWLFFYLRPYRYQKKRKGMTFPDDDALPAISVIVTSKNSAEELARNLPFIIEQDYPDFEVIVVNSGSTDDTDMVLKAAEQKYPRLYHTFVPAETGGINEKKLALTLGIKAAKNDCLLFTEAYCRPCSRDWIKEYGKEFAQGKEVVLGFSRLEIPPKTGLRGFMLYDNLVHHLKFLSLAILRRPFMGTGRNMGYKKELFFRHKGFSPILNLEGGEDDLYINRIAPKKKTGVVLSPESMTETDSIKHFSAWRALKSGYLYSKQYYKGFLFRLFGLETFSKYLFYLLFICTIIPGVVTHNPILAATALLLFAARYAVQWRVVTLNSRLFGAGKYHVNLPFYDIFQPLNNARFRRYANRRNKIITNY